MSGRRERGFSLVEVIIAMTILSIVLGGAAMAVVSADNTEMRTKAVADSHAMAEKAVERLRNDLSAQTYCDTQSQVAWIQTAKAVKQNPTSPAAASETNFRDCPIQYNDMRDAKGRLYEVALVIDAKDRPDDGFGINDSDGDLRDAYEVETTVQLAADSTAGRESMATTAITLGGTVDWEGGSSDDASIRVLACAIDRPDRALMAGGCSAGDPSRQPMNVSVGVQRLNEETGAVANTGLTITANGAPGMVPPGSYQFAIPNVGGYDLLKVDPQTLRAYGSQNYTIQVTYVRSALTVRVCTQINTWQTDPENDGYEVTATNLHWRRTNQPGRRSMRLTLNGDNDPQRGVQRQYSGNRHDDTGNRWDPRPGQQPDTNRTWNCGHVMLDPAQAQASCPENPYPSSGSTTCPSLFRGLYDIEVEQVDPCRTSNSNQPCLDPSARLRYFQNIASRYNLRVTQASMNCRLAAWDQPMGGTPLLSRGADPSNERTNDSSNRGPFLARMAINGGGTQTLCLRFYSKNFERIRCYDRNDGRYVWDAPRNPAQRPGGCFYVGTYCTLPLPPNTQDNDNNCWNGADVCMTCGGGGVQGTAGPVHARRQSGGVSGGPNDTTVACSTRSSYNWPGSWHAGWGMSSLIGAGTRNSYDWIGGDSFYRSNFSGRTSARAGHPYGVHPDRFTYNLPDNPAYHCEMSYFTAGSALFAGNGGPYRYYECLEVSVPGRPYKVRGRLLDVSGSGTTFYGTVGTALALAPDSNIMQNYWNPFNVGGGSYPAVTGGGNWPDYNVARVTGDPNCGAPTIHIDPIIWELWETVIDEAPARPAPAPPNRTNLVPGKVGV